MLETLEPRLLLSTTYIVNSLADTVANDGLLTLREAIQAANSDAAVNEAPSGSGADTIVFDSALFAEGPASLTLGGTQLLITDALTITGPGAELLTIDANGLSRVLEINGQGAVVFTANLSGITLAGGQTAGNGGAVLNAENTTLEQMALMGNQAANGGAIQINSGTLVLRDSTLAGNTASATGGGVAITAGVFHSYNSTISGNTAGTDGGGIRAAGTVTIHNSTIADNDANRGGGLYSTGNTTLRNSIVADNDAITSGPDVSGTIQATQNLVGIKSLAVLIGQFNIVDTDAKLAPLAQTGNGTPTHALLPGSPAIDAGDLAFDPATFNPAMLADQRGSLRLMDGNDDGIIQLDLGAYEADQLGTGGLSAHALGFPVVYGETTARFIVRVTDNVAVDASSIETGDFRVRGPNGYEQAATLLGTNVNTDSATIFAYYQVNAPGGVWDLTDSGVYTIASQHQAVSDTAGNVVQSGDIASYEIKFADIAYTLTGLGAGVVSAGDVNASGQIAAQTNAGDAVLWDQGIVTNLGTLAGGTAGAIAAAIDDAGTIVGQSSTSGAAPDTAYVWATGVMTDLALGTGSIASDLNSSGQITGSAVNGANTQAYHLDGATRTNIPTLGGDDSQGLAINDSNHIVGWSQTATGNREHAFFWDGAVVADLGTFGGTHSVQRESIAHAISASDDIAGASLVPNRDAVNADDSSARAFVWSGGQLRDIGLFDGALASESLDINDAGQIVGGVYATASDAAFLWQDGVLYNLNDLVDMGDWQSLTIATAINEDGTIVGHGIDDDGQQQAFVLTQLRNVQTPIVEGTVWNDLNSDGVRQEGEFGVEGAVVELVNLTDGSTIGYQVTDAWGEYRFGGVLPADYTLKVRVPSTYVFTAQDIGDDATDSDVNAVGQGPVFTIDETTLRVTLDAGVIGSETDFGFAFGKDRTDALVIAVAPDGGFYMAGDFTGSVSNGDFDPGPGTWMLGQNTAAVAKYTAKGALVWVTSPLPGAIGESLAVGSDAQGNVYITGVFANTFTIPGLAPLVPLSGGNDIFLAKLDADGNWLWAGSYGTTSANDNVRDMAVSASGSIILTGTFRGTIDFDMGPGVYNVTSRVSFDDGYVVEYDTNGQLVWANKLQDASLFSVAIGPDGSGYVTGRTQIAKLHHADGSLVWSNSFPVQYQDIMVVHDGIESLYLAGRSPLDATIPTLEGNVSLPYSSGFVIKLNEGGEYLWARTTERGGQVVPGAAFANSGGIVTAGRFFNEVDFDPGIGVDLHVSPFQTSDAFVWHLSAEGEHEVAWSIGGTSTDQLYAIAVDAEGSIILAGAIGTPQSIPVDLDPSAGVFPFVAINSSHAVLKLNIASVGDRVWQDLNGDGIQDEGEPGLADVVVRLYDTVDGIKGNEDDVLVGQAITDANGHYLIKNLLTGEHYLEFIPPAGYTFTARDAGLDDALDSDAGPDGFTDLFDLHVGLNLSHDAGFVTSQSIAGVVWDDADIDGIRDAGEPLVAGGIAQLFDPVNGIIGDGDDVQIGQDQITLADGSYLFNQLEPGDYYVRFIPASGYIFTLADQGGDDTLDSDAHVLTGRTALITLGAGQTVGDLDAGVLTGSVISGQTWNDLNADGIRTDGEPGVAGSIIRLFDTVDGIAGNGDDVQVGSDHTTLDDGHYSFVSVRPGVYYVQVIGPQGLLLGPRDAGEDDTLDSDFDVTTGQSGLITLDYYEDATNIDAALDYGSSITGIIWQDANENGLRDEDEVGIAGALIDLYNDAGVSFQRTQSDTDGHYTLSMLPPGNYHIQVRTSAHYTFTLTNTGEDDSIDSDFDANGNLATFTLDLASSEQTYDAGLIGEIPSFGWVFSLATTGTELIDSVVTDELGNVYIAGTLYQTLDVDPGPGVHLLTLTNTTRADAFVAKYNPQGDLVWATKTYLSDRGSSYFLREGAADLGLDDQGNIYQVGTSLGDGIIVKLNSDGEKQWTRQILDDPGGIQRVAVDPQGNAFVYGAVRRLIPTGNDFTWDSYVAKYDTDGNQGWLYDIHKSVGFGGITADANGHVYVTGTITENYDFDPGPGQHLAGGGNGEAPFVWTLDTAGSFVDVFVNQQIGRTQDIGLDAAGNIYTVGIEPGIGSSWRVRDSKFDTDGNLLWSNYLLNNAQSNTVNSPLQMAVTSDGRTHVTMSNFGDPGIGIEILDTHGTALWHTELGTQGNYSEGGRGIAVAPDGSIFVSGYFTNQDNLTDFDPSSRLYTIDSQGGTDAFLLKLNTLSTIAGSAWFDFDGDGVRGNDDVPISGVGVRIYDSINGIIGDGDDVLVHEALTNVEGRYEYIALSSSAYYVVFEQPEGLTWTAQNRGDELTDSDPDAIWGVTDLFTLAPGLQRTDIDAGYAFVFSAPQGVDDAYIALKNTPLVIDPEDGVLINDTDALPLVAVIISHPLHGTIDLNEDGSFEYTPDEGYLGSDSFTYRAFNGDLASLDTVVSIQVKVAPTTAGVGDVVVLASTGPTIINLFDRFDDEDGSDEALVFTVTGNTNAALFDAVTIDPVTSLITIDTAGVTGESDITIRATDADGLFVETTFNVLIVDNIAAPVLEAEPVITSGAANTITWLAIENAQEYFAEYDDDPTFASPNGNSGWITETSHEFTGLTPSTTFHYRVKARRSAQAGSATYVESTPSQFQAGTLTNVVVTAGGDVTLVDGVPAPVNVDTVGGDTTGITRTNFIAMNGFYVTQTRMLTEIEAYLDIPVSTALAFNVYVNDTGTAGYSLVEHINIADSGTGEGFYGSGPIAIELTAGRYYAIAVAWQGTAEYFSSSPASSNRSTDFGDQYGSQVFTSGYPGNINTTGVHTHGGVVMYQRLTSTAVQGHATDGSLVSPPISPAQFDEWVTLLANATIPAETTLTFDILPETGDEPIEGYENVAIGADLAGINESLIRLRANFTSANPDQSPMLHDWGVRWNASATVVIESEWSDVESSTQSGPPTTTGIADVIVDQEAAPVVIDLFAAFDDVEEADDELVYTIESNTNPELFDSVIIDPVAGTLTLDFLATAYGQGQITIRATDSGDEFVETTFTVIVDDAPTTTGIDDVSVLEDAPPVVIDLFAAFADSVDADEDLIYTIVTNTAAALFTSTDIDALTGELALVFAANAFGDGSITVRATDTLGRAVEAAFAVTVASVNDQPTTTGLAPVNAFEDGDDQVIDLFAAFDDVETADEDLILTIESNTNASLFSSVAIDDDTGLLTLSFAPEIAGSALLVLRATDALGLFIETTLIVNVEALADISGIVWHDLNGDGTQALNDPGQADVTVYIDLNNNGVFDDGEPTQITGSDGSYRFTGLVAGVYTVAEVAPTGFVQTSPGALGSPVPPFRIDLLYGAGITESQKAIFAQAATRWSQIIIADLPDAITDVGIVDDLAISIRGITIDGEGDTLAQAAPTQLRAGSNLPVRGVMDMDIDDLAALEASGDLYQIVLHEMAHVLGFGNLWVNMDLITGAGTSDPQFTGAQAAAVYATLTGSAQTSVPVANTGGTGTRDIHWREVIFDNELLTGVIDAGSNPLSRLTIAALADMGYTVNLNAADPYTLPGGNSTGGTGAVSPFMPPRPFAHQVVIAGGIDVDHVDFGNAALGSVVVGPQVAGLTPAPGSTLTEATIHIDITFTKAMMPLDATDLVLTGAGAADSVISAPISQGGNTWRFTVSGLVPGDLNVTLAPNVGDVQDLSGNDLDPLSWSYKVDDQVADAPPIVTAVMIGSTTWGSGDGPTPSDVGDDSGYLMPVSSDDQLDPLPWQKIDRISVRFSEAVDVQADDLTLLGVKVPNYTAMLTGFTYDSATFTATWQLATPIAIDKLRLILSDRIEDMTGRALDGDWIDGSSAASGNGSEGGDFQFRFNVLPGDVDGSGEVDANDVALVRAAQFQSTGGAGYDQRYDINGSGTILIDDQVFVRNQQTKTLPLGEPAFTTESPVGEPVTILPINIPNESAIATARLLASYALAHGNQGLGLVNRIPRAATVSMLQSVLPLQLNWRTTGELGSQPGRAAHASRNIDGPRNFGLVAPLAYIRTHDVPAEVAGLAKDQWQARRR